MIGSIHITKVKEFAQGKFLINLAETLNFTLT